VIFKEELEAEITWLEDSVYFAPFRGLTRDINLNDTFKG
jgi:hypothetical protein